MKLARGVSIHAITDRWSTMKRKSTVATVVLATLVVILIVSCGESRPGATVSGDTTAPVSCATPQSGCSCSPGSVAACGKRVDGDLNFIYCYEGHRYCLPSGVYGDCVDGAIVTKSLAPTLHTSSLGAPSVCLGADSAPLLVCTSGKQQGEYCTTALDCSGGVKKCLGGANDGASCKKEKDCADPGDCTSFAGTCTGGTRNGFGCNALADCTGGGTACAPAGGGGTCGLFTGICNNGSNDGEACNAAPDCPGGTCETDRHGHCEGGKENAKKCRHNGHCKDGGSCSAEDPGTPGTTDPCDPYCNVTADTAVGVVAPGFVVVNGGLVPTGGVTCGDSIVSPPENCDDGNTMAGDGCSASCRIEPGFQCPMPGTACSFSMCGNGMVEGIEQCDDGPWVADSTGTVKDRPYDGCYNCQKEFKCPVGPGPGPTACVAVCGDGIVFPGEACDDGNATNGDGCSSTCTIEPGATCMNVPAPLPPFLDVPMIYRDFDTFGGAANSPDFQFSGGGLPDSIPHKPGGTGGGCVAGTSQGIPQVGLSTVDREPVLLSPQTCILNAASYATWYHDSPNNKVILGKFLRLGAVAPVGTYRFDSAADPPYNLPNVNCGNAVPTQTCAAYGGFFPINGLGYGNQVIGKNYSFTSEVRFPFTYAGGEVLTFIGDDDMWVWIGGRKVVDIGNPHTPVTGQVTLNLGGSVSVPNTVPASVPPITLVVGQSYEIDVFHAERNSTGSNYSLTLAGFNRKTSQCTIPPPPATFVRDFHGVCPTGTSVVWQLFRWKAGVPAGAQIDFRASTAMTQAALPAAPPAAAPGSVPIGSATPANSPSAGPVVFVNDTLPGPVPEPVSQHLQIEGLGTKSQAWLRVYMTFSGLPTLFEWQQLFDCVPAE